MPLPVLESHRTAGDRPASTRMPAPKRHTPLKRSKVAGSEFRNLMLQATGPNWAELAAPGLRCQLSIIAGDLFRVRVTRARGFSKAESWAVVKTLWPKPAGRVLARGNQLRLSTTEGTLALNLNTGSWRLNDRYGVEVFASPAGGIRFDPAPKVRFGLTEGESIHGLGESSGTFNKRGLIREFWNIDVGGHADAVHAGLRNMYVSIPFGISLRDGRAAGLFWDNPARQRWDLGQTALDVWQMEAASGEVDLYLFLGPTCAEVTGRFTELTGRMPLPPLWGLGYQQCRYSYETRQRVEEIAATFRRKQIPCDVIYLDIHYMDGYRVFTFGKDFPAPAQMISRLAKAGFKTVTIVDPGVKDDPAFAVLRRGRALNAFVKDPGGKRDYLGKVWPGRVRFPDFLNPICREWWGREQSAFQSLGVAGFWNDMNEPADFSTKTKDFPAASVHDTGAGKFRHAGVHNVYGSQMARASYEGALTAVPDRRPFVITRAGYAGLQRHALVWTGDNDSTWDHLADSVQMLLNLSLSGVAFCGADVGGFHDNATGELLARWTQFACLTPFFRNHSDIRTISQEPWAFGPQIEAICRRYIELRYQLIPYLYGLFVEAHRHGTPVIRPMFWQYQNDPKAVAASDQFMLGSELLVAPIVRQAATARSVYLPPDLWFDFWTGEPFRGGAHILAEAELARLPLFVRGGAILPLVPVRQHLGQPAAETVNLHLWPGARGHLTWYEDDGESFDYTRGHFYEREISCDRRRNIARLSFHTPAGAFRSAVKRWRVVLRNTDRPLRARIGRKELPVLFNHEAGVCVIDVPNTASGFEVEWRGTRLHPH